MFIKNFRFFSILVFLFSVFDYGFLKKSFAENVLQSETIVVSATRIETPQKYLAENITVYTKEEIQKLPARDLSEILSYIPGVDVQLNGQFGQATSVSIYGSESRHVLLMVDGIPFNNQISGQANPTRIGVEHIERIEVIKGASSSAWGSSLGGVINVI
ncbi:Outer membrane vitamin B12 receptor BtuB, partial [hydrothermal vent metagenome]